MAEFVPKGLDEPTIGGHILGPFPQPQAKSFVARPFEDDLVVLNRIARRMPRPAGFASNYRASRLTAIWMQASVTKAAKVKLEYEVQASAKVEHVHLFVDGDEVGMVHKLKGSFELGPLKAGERKVCVSPVNKNHTPIGAQACITVTVQ